MLPCFKDVDDKNQNLKTFDVGLLFLRFPVSLNALPCSVVLPPALNLSETPYPRILPSFSSWLPIHHFPTQTGSLHHDTLPISFFPEYPNNILSIYQSIFLPIIPVSHLYFLKPLSYPIFIISHRYDRELFTGMCVVMFHKHMCVEVRGHLWCCSLGTVYLVLLRKGLLLD